MKKILSLIFFMVSFFCVSAQKNQTVSIPELGLNFNREEVKLSKEAEEYIESVIALMKTDALHRQELNFDKIRQAIRYYADGAKTVEDTHQAIKKSLPLLKDHHSYFMTSAEVDQNLGLNEEDIEEIKKGRAPHIDDIKLDSLSKHLEYASGQILDGNVGYLSVPSFENLYSEAMTMFADSLQSLIRQFDQQNMRGWVVDLRDNDGGAAMPMIAGLGPLLDSNNAYYTVDEEGRKMAKSYYKDGGYYDVEAGKKEVAPLVRSSVNYQLANKDIPVIILTGFKTASSAEAVTAIFAGQPNVKILGSKTHGLTSTNSFNFLEDNSVLNITIGYYANRHHQMYKQGIAPDVEVKSDTRKGINIENDIVVLNALKWINQ